MVTTLEKHEAVKEYKKSGADGYLHKWFEINQVTDMLKGVLN